jgi:hypothetical protein
VVSVASLQVDIYGTPYLGMDMVRNSGIGAKPGSARGLIYHSGVSIVVEYIKPLIKQSEVTNLLSAVVLDE